jgi:hypothetical protein
MPDRTNTFRFNGVIYASSETINLRCEEMINGVELPVPWDSWISKLTVLLDDVSTSGTFALRVLKNGSTISTSSYPLSFVQGVDTFSEYGTRKNVSTSDTNSFSAGDELRIQVVTTDWLPINCPIQVFVELAR